MSLWRFVRPGEDFEFWAPYSIRRLGTTQYIQSADGTEFNSMVTEVWAPRRHGTAGYICGVYVLLHNHNNCNCLRSTTLERRLVFRPHVPCSDGAFPVHLTVSDAWCRDIATHGFGIPDSERPGFIIEAPGYVRYGFLFTDIVCDHGN